VQADRFTPKLIVPDAGPLIHLAAGDVLHLLTDMAETLVPDIVVLETTYNRQWPLASEIADWIEVQRAAGRLTVAATAWSPLYLLAREQGLPPPRDAGDIAIADWVGAHLTLAVEPVLVVYENGAVPRRLNREGVAADIGIATTRAFLHLAQAHGLLDDAETAWRGIVERRPTANELNRFQLLERSR
jgi:hypothetical protein